MGPFPISLFTYRFWYTQIFAARDSTGISRLPSNRFRALMRHLCRFLVTLSNRTLILCRICENRLLLLPV